MAWTTPLSFLVGQVIDSNLYNTYGRDNENFLHDNTWFKIDETILSGTASSINSNSINTFSMYNSLMLLGAVRFDTTTAATQFLLQFNGDTGNNYSYNQVEFSGSAVVTTTSGISTSSIKLGIITLSSSPASFFTIFRVLIINHGSASNYKSVESHAASKIANAGATTDLHHIKSSGWWLSAFAITGVQIKLTNAGNFIAGSYLDVYGLTT
jgi:hypothetical protein